MLSKLNLNDRPLQQSTIAAQVVSAKRLSPNIVWLRVRLGVTAKAYFRAGQWARLTLPTGQSRCFSFSNRYDDDGLIDFHVRVRPDGAFARWLSAYDGYPNENAQLVLSDAFGVGLWDHVPDNSPVIMLATGTGIAPIKAMLEEALTRGFSNRIHLYWGNRHRVDFYLHEYLKEYARQNRNFRYTPVLSGKDPTWFGRIGRVHDVALADRIRYDNFCGYACGSPAMVYNARTLFEVQGGDPSARFFSDAFEDSNAEETVISPADAQQCVHVVLPDNTRRSVKVVKDHSLMSVLKQQKIVTAVCGGKGVCGTCRVAISPAWFEKLQAPKVSEVRLLQALDDATPLDRLSCQILMTSDLDELELQILERAL